MYVNGIKMTYYMKNGTEIVDESFRFLEPVEEDSKEVVEILDKVKKSIRNAMKPNVEGCMVCGNLYVRVADLSAVRIELIEF